MIVRPPDVIELASSHTSSCGRGTENPLAPPLVSDQFAVFDHVPPVTPTQYLLTDAGKVILVFPPASPKLVPVHVAPLFVQSMKSTYERLTAAALIVYGIPCSIDCDPKFAL